MSLSILLTASAPRCWNFVVVRNGRPLPADDPVDAETAGAALRLALLALQAEMHGRQPTESEDRQP